MTNIPDDLRAHFDQAAQITREADRKRQRRAFVPFVLLGAVAVVGLLGFAGFKAKAALDMAGVQRVFDNPTSYPEINVYRLTSTRVGYQVFTDVTATTRTEYRAGIETDSGRKSGPRFCYTNAEVLVWHETKTDRGTWRHNEPIKILAGTLCFTADLSQTTE